MTDIAVITEADLSMLDRSTTHFGDLLASQSLVGDQPSRCEGWSTRDVANHVLGGAIRYTHYFSGGDHDGIAWTRTADHIGDDGPGRYRALCAALRREFMAHRDDGIVLHHSIQDVDAATLLVMRIQELVLHRWDIESTFTPDVELDPDLCRYLLERGSGMAEVFRANGVLGPAAMPADDSDAARLLAEWGRGR